MDKHKKAEMMPLILEPIKIGNSKGFIIPAKFGLEDKKYLVWIKEAENLVWIKEAEK